MDIVAYRDVICNQNGCPMVHLIKGNLYAILTQEMKKWYSFWVIFKIACKPFQDRHTEILAYRGAICNQKGCPMVHWIIGSCM